MFLFIPFSVRALTFGTFGSAVLFYLVFIGVGKLFVNRSESSDIELQPSKTILRCLVAIGALLPLILLEFKHSNPAVIYLLITIFAGGLFLPTAISKGIFAILSRSDVIEDDAPGRPARPKFYILSILIGIHTLGVPGILHYYTEDKTDYFIFLMLVILIVMITVRAARRTTSITQSNHSIPVQNINVADELTKLHMLKEKGGLTEEEYAEQKKKVLNR